MDCLPAEPQGKPKNTGVGRLSFLQWIFPTQELNRGLLQCRQILYQLNYQGSLSQFHLILSQNFLYLNASHKKIYYSSIIHFSSPFHIQCTNIHMGKFSISLSLFRQILKHICTITRSPAFQVDSLPAEPKGKPKNTGVGRRPLLQRIFPTQKSNWGLLLCRQILYQLNNQGSPSTV